MHEASNLPILGYRANIVAGYNADYNQIITVEPRLMRTRLMRDVSRRYIALAMELLTSRYQRAGGRARDSEGDISDFFEDTVTYKRRVVKTRLGHVRGRYRDFGSLQRAVNRATPLCSRASMTRKPQNLATRRVASRRVAADKPA